MHRHPRCYLSAGSHDLAGVIGRITGEASADLLFSAAQGAVRQVANSECRYLPADMPNRVRVLMVPDADRRNWRSAWAKGASARVVETGPDRAAGRGRTDRSAYGGAGQLYRADSDQVAPPVCRGGGGRAGGRAARCPFSMILSYGLRPSRAYAKSIVILKCFKSRTPGRLDDGADRGGK
jgi:hypothetical protein